jgi:hypothetical protein
MNWLVTNLRRWLPGMKAPGTPEDRRYPRYKMQLSVTVIAAGKTYRGGCCDLSLSGMGLSVEAEFEIGEQVRLQYELGDGSPMKNLNAVVRNRAGHRYGVEFIDG